MTKFDYSYKNLKNAVEKSRSYLETLRNLGTTSKGGNYKTLQRKIKEYNIDTSHFLGKGWNKNGTYERVPIEEYLNNKRKISTYDLKRRLIKSGLKEDKCECCGVSEWQGHKLTIQLHHIDGDNENNNLDNLQLLCPNCHSITDNYAGKNTKKHNIIRKYEDFYSMSDEDKDKILNEKRIKKEKSIEERKKIKEKEIEERIKIIKESTIDFSQNGWAVRLGKLLNTTPQTAARWLKKYMPGLYDESKHHSHVENIDIRKIINEYVNTDKTIKKIAEENSSSFDTIKKILKDNNILITDKKINKNIKSIIMDNNIQFENMDSAIDYLHNIGKITNASIKDIRNSITRVLNNKRKTAYGHTWEYAS